MALIGLFFGSTNGHTAAIARKIKQILDDRYAPPGGEVVELFDLAEFYLADATEFDRLILGVPTWNVGQLQRDWEAAIDELDELDLRGVRAALFGLGDQAGYPDTFGDALFFVGDRLRRRGAMLVGEWPVAGYTFNASWAMEDDRFLGLMLDEEHQPELTAGRLATWLEQVAYEFGLA
jgi:flavodoxin long chain